MYQIFSFVSEPIYWAIHIPTRILRTKSTDINHQIENNDVSCLMATLSSLCAFLVL
jgi:hypothetical protein